MEFGSGSCDHCRAGNQAVEILSLGMVWSIDHLWSYFPSYPCQEHAALKVVVVDTDLLSLLSCCKSTTMRVE